MLNDSTEISPLAVHAGRLGLSSCPGWPRGFVQSPDLTGAVEAIRRWPATALVSLMETPEFERLGLSELPRLFDQRMPIWLHLPIRDGDIPGTAWLDRWRLARLVIAKILLEGDNVVIHCLGGLGRTGTVAALCLIDAGLAEGRETIKKIRHAHNIHALETPEQRRFVCEYSPEPILTEATVRSGLAQISAQLEMRTLLTEAGEIDLANVRIALEQTRP